MGELEVTPVRHVPYPGHLAPDAIADYAVATGDNTRAVLEGVAVPAVFPVILVFDAQEAARADLRRPRGSALAVVCTANTTSCCTDH